MDDTSVQKERKVLNAIRKSVYFTKLLETHFEKNKKWILASSKPSYKSKIFARMFNNKESADVTIRVKTEPVTEYHLHRSYVQEWSPVLKEKFVDRIASPHQILELENFGASTKRLYDHIFQFMYYDTVAMDSDDFLNLLALSVHFRVEAVITELAKIASDLIEPPQAIRLIEQSFKSDVPELKSLIEKCAAILGGSFEKLVNSGEISDLGLGTLKELLALDTLESDSEFKIFLAVKKWVLKEKSREEHLDDLLSLVRFPVIEGEFLTELFDDELYSKTPKMRSHLIEALKFLAHPDMFESESKAKRFLPREGVVAPVAEHWKFTDHKEKVIEYEIPGNGYFTFIARGAKAADGNTKKGGSGAIMQATFKLSKGDKLWIIVGGMSKKRSGDTGGGGGTFVAINDKTKPLIVAGGGGGTRGASSDKDGSDASLTPDGAKPNGANVGIPGTAGQGGKAAASSYGAGGGGWFSDGIKNGSNCEPGTSFANMLAGKKASSVTPFHGGWGGGGDTGRSGGGGGGGYSGGAGGQGAGGGGSYIRADGMAVSKKVGWILDGELELFSTSKPKM